MALYFSSEELTEPPKEDDVMAASTLIYIDNDQAADGGALLAGAIDSFAQTFSALALAALAISSF